MPGKDEPIETNHSLKSQIKKFFNKLSDKFKTLKGKHIKHVGSQVVDNEVKHEQSLTVKKFESFADKTAEDVIIPRSDITAVNLDITLQDLSKVIIKHGHTRTLVYKENLDNIIGFIHIKDLFEVIAKSKKYNLKRLIRKHLVSPHSMKLGDLLWQMQLNRTHIAVVVDEYGGTDGIVTIEDIIEAIVGRIDDEHDDQLDIENFKILKPGLIIANARMEVEELEKILSIELKTEEDEFDTIGGLVLAKVGSVPDKGQIIRITDAVTVEVMDSTPRTIKQLKIICDKNVKINDNI